ncbi:MAG TPA: metal ABC transporter permease [Chlorobaculum parvum]|uniref:Metal ABC transporter permease n=1 Tax=Chlorobaculum parvum TaxID=274539 RepID=A0A7C5DHN8_9CHLB|nr:metal ABC transporter permease [Chlorobaculum parvum]
MNPLPVWTPRPRACCWSLSRSFMRRGASQFYWLRMTWGLCEDTRSESFGCTTAGPCMARRSCATRSAWRGSWIWSPVVNMEALLWVLSPDFLLRNSVYTSVLIGLVCPLVGVFLALRRLIFMGLALPQISSTGVALSLSLPFWLGITVTSFGPHGEYVLAFAGSIVCTMSAIFVLAALEHRGRGLSEGRLGTAYVVAAALGILVLAKNRYGELGWLDLLKGEVITVSSFDLWMTFAVLALAVTVLGLFHKEILLVSFDRAMAITLRKNVVFWDVVLYLLIGLTVSIAVLSVGPLIAFGFLLIPVLVVHPFVRTMRQFSVAASLLGGLASLIGFWIAYAWDLPVGPTDVVLLGLCYGIGWVAHQWIRMRRAT